MAASGSQISSNIMAYIQAIHTDWITRRMPSIGIRSEMQRMQTARNRGNRLAVNLAAIWLLLVAVWLPQAQSRAGVSSGANTPVAQSQPNATLTAFYHWYLDELAAELDPLHDRTKIEAYVSKALLKDLDERINSAKGIDEDYFLKAQDYLEDWASSIVVSDVRINGNTASATVTLGATKQSRHRLTVNLLSEESSWKITKVNRPAGS
jgi:hypothetical protein